MNRSSDRSHPGARLFEKALACISTGQHKWKSMDTKITERSVPVSSQSYPVSLMDKTHLHNVGNCHTNFISEVPAENDFHLPVYQPDQPSISYHPGVYQSSEAYSSTTSQFGSSTNYSLDVFSSAMVPCRTPMAYSTSSTHHLNYSQGSDASIYSFSCLSLMNNHQSGLSSNFSANPAVSSRTSSKLSSAFDDYRLPLTLPKAAPDSGYPSSDDGSSSGTSSPDYGIGGSMSTYHLVNRPESPSETTQASHENLLVEVVPKQRMVHATLQCRVNRRSMPRQGNMTSFGTETHKSLSTRRKDLSSLFLEGTHSEVSEDSGAEVSTDDDPSLVGCSSCEKQSEKLRRNDSRTQWSALPDYSHLNFLEFKTETGFIDSHCHLDFLFDRQNYDGTYSDYMLKHRDTYPVTYEGCVAVFCNPRTFHKKTMWQRYLRENGVWGAFGCHPHNANVYSPMMEKALRSALHHSKVRALGEIGLDYSNRNDCSKERQHLVFKRQLKIAMRNKLPLVIHCRDANEDCMDIMKEILPKDYTIHLHCFTDGWDQAQKWLEEFPNLFIGITNVVTYSSAKPTHDVVKNIPLDRLLLETDAPYFVPRKSPRSTKWSHPGMAIHVAAQIATLRNLPLREIIHMTRQNTNKMYGI